MGTCSGHGRCGANGCNCFFGWTGGDCGSSIGKYDICLNGTYGDNCERSCTMNTTCSGHGRCGQRNDACNCFSGWSGPSCSCDEYHRAEGLYCVPIGPPGPVSDDVTLVQTSGTSLRVAWGKPDMSEVDTFKIIIFVQGGTAGDTSLFNASNISRSDCTATKGHQCNFTVEEVPLRSRIRAEIVALNIAGPSAPRQSPWLAMVGAPNSPSDVWLTQLPDTSALSGKQVHAVKPLVSCRPHGPAYRRKNPVSLQVKCRSNYSNLSIRLRSKAHAFRSRGPKLMTMEMVCLKTIRCASRWTVTRYVTRPIDVRMRDSRLSKKMNFS